MEYKTLEKEVAQRKYNLTKPSWSGNLTKRGLKSIQWGDLKEIETQTLKSK